jgi:hypothetical protein
MLAENQTGLDGLAETYLVGEDHALQERAAKGEQCGLDLVRVEVHAGVEQGHRQTDHAA